MSAFLLRQSGRHAVPRTTTRCSDHGGRAAAASASPVWIASSSATFAPSAWAAARASSPSVERTASSPCSRSSCSRISRGKSSRSRSTSAAPRRRAAAAASRDGSAAAIPFGFSDGYPYFLQEYGKHAWLVADVSPISQANVERAHPTVLNELDEGFFYVRIERATDAERKYMAAVADLGDGRQRSGSIATRLEYETSSAISLTRDSLLKKG